MAADGTQGHGIRKSFGTMQPSLIAVRTWLKQLNVTPIAMEFTGVYWMPVRNVLEVAIGQRLEFKLLNDWQDVGQRADLGERRFFCRRLRVIQHGDDQPIKQIGLG